MQKEAPIIIIGAGLTGLSLAYFLEKKGRSALILEARERIGGRIYTLKEEGKAPIEMGATWLGKKHKSLIALLKELEIPIFEQKIGSTAVFEPISTSPPQVVSIPSNEEPSYRIAGGTSRLIDALSERLKKSSIQKGVIVENIRKSQDGTFMLGTNKGEFYSSVLVSTLPPNLSFSTIVLDLDLPQNLKEIALKTHTWMGESIKIGFAFEEAFWEKQNLSGTVFSSVGPIPELYDHSTLEGDLFALKGFFNAAFAGVKKEQRKKMALAQLKRYFGAAIDSFTSYEELVWAKEAFTFCNYKGEIYPHQNNGHDLYRSSFENGGFFVAGTETAAAFPGYMDGAVNSALEVVEKINLEV